MLRLVPSIRSSHTPEAPADVVITHQSTTLPGPSEDPRPLPLLRAHLSLEGLFPTDEPQSFKLKLIPEMIVTGHVPGGLEGRFLICAEIFVVNEDLPDGEGCAGRPGQSGSVASASVMWSHTWSRAFPVCACRPA